MYELYNMSVLNAVFIQCNNLKLIYVPASYCQLSLNHEQHNNYCCLITSLFIYNNDLTAYDCNQFILPRSNEAIGIRYKHIGHLPK